MDKLSFFMYNLWTNLPLLFAGYLIIKGIIKVESNQNSYRNIASGLIGLLAYFIYMGALLLYIKDDALLVFLADLLKIIGPIYVIYLMLGVKYNKRNSIIEASTIILAILLIGLWRIIKYI